MLEAAASALRGSAATACAAAADARRGRRGVRGRAVAGAVAATRRVDGVLGRRAGLTDGHLRPRLLGALARGGAASWRRSRCWSTSAAGRGFGACRSSGALLGGAATMRTEALVYALVAVGVGVPAPVATRLARPSRSCRRGRRLAGFAALWVGNVALEGRVGGLVARRSRWWSGRRRAEAIWPIGCRRRSDRLSVPTRRARDRCASSGRRWWVSCCSRCGRSAAVIIAVASRSGWAARLPRWARGRACGSCRACSPRSRWRSQRCSRCGVAPRGWSSRSSVGSLPLVWAFQYSAAAGRSGGGATRWRRSILGALGIAALRGAR